jgi:hypothetical protein
MDDLNLIASSYVLDLLRPEEVVQLADKALTSGQYSAEAAELADLRTERHPSSAAVVPLFLAWLRAHGIELPNIEDAVWKLLTHHIGQIVHGRVPPLEGLVSVVETLYYSALPNGRSSDVEQQFGVIALCTAYSAMEDLHEYPEHASIRGKLGIEAMTELSSRVRKLAEIWWKTYGPAPVFALDSPEAKLLLSKNGIS